jgi:hypothetical protein
MNKKTTLAAVTIPALVPIGGVAYATIPDGQGVIHACYAKSGGALRVIDASVANCKTLDAGGCICHVPRTGLFPSA